MNIILTPEQLMTLADWAMLSDWGAPIEIREQGDAIYVLQGDSSIIIEPNGTPRDEIAS